MEEAKKAFLHEFGDCYGYRNASKNIDEIRDSEFKRLKGTVYLDHAGATLYSETQMESIVKELTSNVYGNPHSQSDSSVTSSDMISAAREQVLKFCNASPEDYSCIFTSGATAALKLVGETFPWNKDSCYMYTLENHNSVLGIREYVLNKGGGTMALDIEQFQPDIGNTSCHNFNLQASFLSEQRRYNSNQEPSEGNTYNLFAFPMECNFSGIKYPLDLVSFVKRDMGRILKDSSSHKHIRGNWMVLIDAAKGCATQSLDLAMYPADFVVLSFYKIFGYPSGLGALLVRHEAANMLKKTYFSGGTVSAAIADIDFAKRRDRIEQVFEDGTTSFLSIASLHHGFRIINMLTIGAISLHTWSLATYVRKILLSLKHGNGVFLCEIYGKGFGQVTPLTSGSIVSFNLRRDDGSWFGYREIEKLASLSGIQLRTGCFCNPGACAKYLDLSHSDMLSNFEAGHVCWDDHDILNGKPTGCVRVSFGYMSTFEDAEDFLLFIKKYFISKNTFADPMTKIKTLHVSEPRRLSTCPILASITVYPIKSCGGFTVDRWPLSESGLLYDREWVLKSQFGVVLTQKKVPQMSKIYTSIDLRHRVLLLESPNCKDKLKIPLIGTSPFKESEELEFSGERFKVQGYNDVINTWFSDAIGRACALLRYSASAYQDQMKITCSRGVCRDVNCKLMFANEAQLLLISADSVSDLNNRVNSDLRREQKESNDLISINSSRFRPNIVISGAKPYDEDRWRTLIIGNAQFTSLGGCNRCQMINLDPQSAKARREPLTTLASYRRVQGKILFGILLRYEACEDDSTERWLEVGQQVLYEYNSSSS